MKKFIKIALLIVERVSGAISAISCFFALFDIGPPVAEILSKWLHISFGSEWLYIIGIICTAIMIIAVSVRVKLFEKNK